ncbi:MAG: ATP-binding protein [Chloroflexota bacterium]
MLKHTPFAVKLGLTLGLTVLVAVGAVALLANRSATREFEAYVSRGMSGRVALLLPALQEHYQRQGSWDGVGTVMEAGLETPGRGMGMQGRGNAGHMAAVILADAQGRVEYASAEGDRGKRLSTRVLRQGQPVTVGSRTVGYLLSGTGAQEQLFRERVNRSILLAGALAAMVAVVLGLALTRAVLQPLRALRDAARRIGDGDLAQRVPATTRDEIGDLGQGFNEMAAALQRDEALRRRMMADIAHELRTPVAVMRAQVEALQDGVFAPTPEGLAPIHDQTLLLGRLINDLRDLALADAGRLPLEMSPLDARALVERVTKAFRPRAAEKQQTIALHLPPELPAVHGDAQRLEQILANLLSNAVRYTPEGGRITMRAAVDGGWLAVSVQDDGPGIAPADLERVFERFYRVDPARAHREAGTGLGLAIARQLAEAHGGTLNVESALGQGSTFTLRLPVAG